MADEQGGTPPPQDNRQESPNSLAASCKDYFDRKGCPYQFVELATVGDSFIKTVVGGVNGTYNMAVSIQEDRQLVIVYVLSILKFPLAHRHKLCEFLTRANYSMTLGNFELDMNDGEVRYKCYAQVGPGGLSHIVLDEIASTAVMTMDGYYEHMVKVSYGVMEPKPAIEAVENRTVSGVALSSSENSRSAPTLSTTNARSLIEHFISQIMETNPDENDNAVSQ